MSGASRTGPSAWWFGVAAAVFVLGLVPLAIVITNTVGGLLDHEVHEFDHTTSTSLELGDDPVAIYTTYEGPGTLRCNGGASGAHVAEQDGSAQATVLPLDHPVWNVEFSTGPQVWHRVAVTPQDWGPGAYLVACTLVSPGAGSPAPMLAYADNPSILGTVAGFVIALGIAGLAILAALAIAIAVGVRRYRARRPPLPRRPAFPPNPPPT